MLAEEDSRRNRTVGQCFGQGKPPTCLILGPHSYLLQAVAHILRAHDFEVFRSGSFALAWMISREFHLMIADVDRNPAILEDVRQSRIWGYEGRIALLATQSQCDHSESAPEVGDVAVLLKPFRLAALLWAVGGK